MTATNRSTLAYVQESTPGTTPATPAMREARVTSNGLVAEPGRTTSAEIRSDRQSTDQMLTSLNVQGPIGLELSFGAHDDFIEAALQGSWNINPTIVNVTADTEISDVSATALTVASGGAAFVAGMLCQMTGFGTVANNRIARVASSTATSITFPAATFTAESVVPLGARVRAIGFEGASADIAATITNGNALTSTTLNFTTLGLLVGEVVRIGGAGTNGFATAGCNGFARISAIAANRLSFDVVPTGFAADAGTGRTIQVYMADVVRNGVTQRAFTFERQQLDHSPATIEYFRGVQINDLSLTLEAERPMTAQMQVMGLNYAVGTTRTAGATDVAAPTNPILTTSADMGAVLRGGAPITDSALMTLGIQISNNLRRQARIGSIQAAGMGNGEISVTGPVTAYFGSPALIAAVIADAETSFMLAVGRQDGDRSAILIDIPRVKLSGSAGVNAKNSDRMFQGTFSAMRSPALGYTIAFQRFHVLPAA